MDDYNLDGDLSDFEMLDDASDEVSYASLAEPSAYVAQVVDGGTASEQPQCSEDAAFVVYRKEYSSSLGGHDDRSASPQADFSTHPERSYQQDVPKDEKDIRSDVLAKIEGIFEAMVDVLLNERGQLSIEIKTRSRSRIEQHDQPDTFRAHTESIQQLCFPGKTEKEAWRFGKRGMPLSRYHLNTDTV
jgi:hypothetical protein